jgi:hypothetical protein
MAVERDQKLIDVILSKKSRELGKMDSLRVFDTVQYNQDIAVVGSE